MNVKLRPLAPGDLVLRKVLGNTKNPAWEKLRPNWEGPYLITSVAGDMCVLLGRFRWKNCTSSLECKQHENVLLLIRSVAFLIPF